MAQPTKRMALQAIVDSAMSSSLYVYRVDPCGYFTLRDYLEEVGVKWISFIYPPIGTKPPIGLTVRNPSDGASTPFIVTIDGSKAVVSVESAIPS